MDNGYQAGSCFIDTKDSTDLKVGDFVVINIEHDLNSMLSGYVLVKGPMSEDEIKKYVEENKSNNDNHSINKNRFNFLGETYTEASKEIVDGELERIWGILFENE